MNTNCFFSNFSGSGRISRQNPGISRQTSLISLVSRDIPNFLAPTHSRGRPPPHQKISGLKSLGLGSFFVPEYELTPEYCGKKVPRAMRAMRGKTLENCTISTVLWVHRKLLQSTVKATLASNQSYESKTGSNRTPATVLWLPLKSRAHHNPEPRSEV